MDKFILSFSLFLCLFSSLSTSALSFHFLYLLYLLSKNHTAEEKQEKKPHPGWLSGRRDLTSAAEEEEEEEEKMRNSEGKIARNKAERSEDAEHLTVSHQSHTQLGAALRQGWKMTSSMDH